MRTRAVIVIVVIALGWCYSAEAQSPYEYLSPVPSSELNSPESTIAVRYGEYINPNSISTQYFTIIGDSSGTHSGRTVLADDNKTVIFTPDQQFKPGERVDVTIRSGILSTNGKTFPDISFFFTVSAGMGQYTQSEIIPNESDDDVVSAQFATYLTVPTALPNITFAQGLSGAADGDVFLSNWSFSGTAPNNLLIVDNSGELIYYQTLAAGAYATDFKKLPSGNLSYYNPTNGSYMILDNTYRLVDEIKAGNGYTITDNHDLQLLPNGHYLFLIYDTQTMDMTTYGGKAQANVIGLIIQELDTKKNVVFQWRSWDHMALTDTVVDLTTQWVDYVHGNAVELDTDDNLLISSRHLNEITKINHQTGAIIWRLGGKNDQFTWLNGAQPFSHQHDIRRLPNGNLTLFDNRNNLSPAYSRAAEFHVDENAKTVELVWEYRSQSVWSFAMGNAQRLPNGNTIIGWGATSGSAAITEVKPDGTKTFELYLPSGHTNYRGYRYTWHGYPTWSPDLVVQHTDTGTKLAYSWNGATDVASYRIYAGESPYTTELLKTEQNSGFETVTIFTGRQAQYCYYKIMPIDNLGRTMQYSEVVQNPSCQKVIYLPILN